MPTVPANQATETDQALPVHPVLIGSQGGPVSVYSVFRAEEKAEARQANPVRSLVQVLETDTARPIIAKGQGAATKAVGQATGAHTAQAIAAVGQGTAALGLGVAETTESALPIAPHQVPTRRIIAKATTLPQAVKPAELVAYAGRDATGVVLQLLVVDGNGAAVDLAWATTVVLVVRNARARWEVTPTKVTAAGYLEAAIPDESIRRVDAVDYQVRADFPDGGSRWTRPGRILLVARL